MWDFLCFPSFQAHRPDDSISLLFISQTPPRIDYSSLEPSGSTERNEQKKTYYAGTLPKARERTREEIKFSKPLSGSLLSLGYCLDQGALWYENCSSFGKIQTRERKTILLRVPVPWPSLTSVWLLGFQEDPCI